MAVIAPGTAVIAPGAMFSMTSLYVGDLHPDVGEKDLFDKFSQAGHVVSIRVCRDAVTRKSLGYAYVNYEQSDQAKQAIETMNFDSLHGKQFRIMWSNRDPSARRSGAGNTFIKNLDKSIDNKILFDTFSTFGEILSCKVAYDANGESKGYGFVHFHNEENAVEAIEKVNGMLLADKQVYVAKFVPRATRIKEMGESKSFKNCFIKNFGTHLDKEGLDKLFEPYGKITSSIVMEDAEGKSKGFGFVAFQESDSAVKACEELNDHLLEGTDKRVVVCRAQKKCERQAELKRRFDLRKAERIQETQGSNLYVKNLDDTVTDDILRKLFESFGTVTSCKVMTDENQLSKGFGFVCFEKPEDAEKARTEMDQKHVTGKPLYVAMAQRKEDRRAQLASQYMLRLANQRMASKTGIPQGAYPTPSHAMYMNAPINAPGPAFMTNTMPMSAAMMGGHPQRWQSRPYLPPMHNIAMHPSYHMGGRRQHNPRQQHGVPARFNNSPQHQSGSRPRKYDHPDNNNLPELTSTQLANATPEDQKQMLGEMIHKRLKMMYPTCDLGKITGMMLEIDNAELLLLVHDRRLFQQRVDEAIQVYNNVGKK
ncbi:unnamed protein product, partial [Mesorhabditis spiculigera]